jgi:hypothetical protein
MFDITGDGVRELMAWTSAGSDDTWLAFDRNHNGIIDDTLELFGNNTPQPSSNQRNGFLALAVYDKQGSGGNNDGRISSADAIFSHLRLWQDINHDGLSEPNELKTLPTLNIAAIDLSYHESRSRDANGNLFRYRAKVFDSNGAQVGRWAWDVFLLISN